MNVKSYQSALVGLLLLVVTAYGDPVYSVKTDDSPDAFVNRDAIMNNDLANLNQATLVNLAGVAMNGVNGGANDSTVLSDGSLAGAYQGNEGLFWGGTYLEVDFNLNDATGGCSEGYNIEQLRVFTGWGDNRKDQWYTIDVMRIGEEAYSRLIEVDLKASGLPTGIESIVTSNNSEYVAMNVKSIKITMFPVVDPSWTQWIGSVYQEMDVVGVAAVPEPMTLSLLAIGAMGIAIRRKR